ncbi:TPA: hypothetical protein ACH3X1_006662 [Trebouxia sp. C0004]
MVMCGFNSTVTLSKPSIDFALVLPCVLLCMPLSSQVERKRKRNAGAAWNRTLEGSAFTECPICGRRVALANINSHLESASCQTTCAQQKVAKTVCPRGNDEIRVTTRTPQVPVQLGQSTASLSQAATNAALSHCSTADLQSNAFKPANVTSQDKPAMLGSQPKQERQAVARSVPFMPQPSPRSQHQLVPHAALPGEYCVPDFVTEQEELDLLHMLDTCSPLWQDKTFNGKHRGKRWGAEMDLGQRTVVEGSTVLAAELHMLIARMQQVPFLRCFQPNEANAIDYRKDLGHWLKAHVDDRLSAKLCCSAGSYRQTRL